MNIKWLKVIASLVLSSQALTAYAYEPDMGHSLLPPIAVELYNQCFPTQSIYKSADMTQRLVQGDTSMDLGYERGDVINDTAKGTSVFSVLLRPFNWHFFSEPQEAYQQKGLVNYSFVNLWQGLRAGYWGNNNTFDRALFIGGFLHFLEDVTVPAHIVPAYHGPVSIVIYGPFSFPAFINYMSDFFEGTGLTGKKIVDKIDNFPVDTARLTAVLKSDPMLCSRILNSQANSLASIKNVTASLTRENLKKEIPGCPNVVWQDFYIMPTGTDYFGRYNIKNNNPLFGNSGTLTNSTNTAACNFSIDDSRYKEFVFAQHQLAVQADMKGLLWGQNNMHCNYSPITGLSATSLFSQVSVCRAF